MTPAGRTHNRIRATRRARGWTQAQLAERAGISRTAVTAVEGERTVPSVDVALRLAAALEQPVESLFGSGGQDDDAPAWAWEQPSPRARFWQAEVGSRLWRYPVEETAVGTLPHDGLGDRPHPNAADPRRTLVVAGCDPAVGLLAAEYARSTRHRLLPLPRSSRAALQLLAEGKVHAAGVHLGADEAGGNASVVAELLGSDYRLLRITRWDEGVVLAPGARVRSVRSAIRARLSWVGREPGSGARQCLDELLGARRRPRRLAEDHRGVARAVRGGWAGAGVCLELAGREARLDFLPVRSEDYDLVVSAKTADDRRIRALVDTVQSPAYRRLLAELPGYDARGTGDIGDV